MNDTFQQKSLINFKGLVLVNSDGLPKIYSSLKMANRTAEKFGAKVIKNVKRYIIVK